jgi:hypothetical protein
MKQYYNFHNLFSFSVEGAHNSVSNFISEEFSQFISNEEMTTVDLKLSFGKKITIPTGSLRLLTDFNYDDKTNTAYLVKNNSTLKYPLTRWPDQVEIEIEDNFPIWFIFYAIERFLYIKMCEKGYVMLHAGAVSEGSYGTIVSALQAGGKTLEILNKVSKGADFLGDDIIFINSKANCLSHPRRVNFNPYHNEHYKKISVIDNQQKKIITKLKLNSKRFILRFLLNRKPNTTIRRSISDIYPEVKFSKNVYINKLQIRIFNENKERMSLSWNEEQACHFLLKNMRHESLIHIIDYVDALDGFNDNLISKHRELVLRLEEKREDILKNALSIMKVEVQWD